MRSIKMLCCLFLTVFAVSLAQAGCSDVEKTLNDIETGDYVSAQKRFEEKVAGNYEEEQETFSRIEEKIENIISSYNDSGKYDEAYGEISKIEKSQIIDDRIIQQAFERLEGLASSKNAFKYGKELFDNKEYIAAWEQLNHVIKEDAEFQKAQDMALQARKYYKEALFSEVASSISAGDYEQALIILTDAEKRLGTDADISSYLAKYQNEKDTLEIDRAIKNAQEMLDAKEYQQAYELLSLYSEEFPDSAEVSIMLITCKKEYIDDALKKAEQAFSEASDYQRACQNISMALKAFPDDAQLLRAYENYQSYCPTRLLEKDYHIRSGLKPQEWTAADRDNLGNYYEYGWKFSWNTMETMSCSYTLDGEFSELTGKFVVGYSARDIEYITIAQKVYCSSQLKVYGDNQLIYTTPIIGYGIDPVAFQIDISNIQEIQFEIVFTSAGLRSLSNGLVDVYVAKK